MRRLMMVMLGSLMAANSFADEAPPKAAGNAFIALPANRAAIQANPMKQQSGPPPRFIAIAPNNFRAVAVTPINTSLAKRVTRHDDNPGLEEASLKEISAERPTPGMPVHGMMSSEQAQQILSIFSPDQ